MIYDWINNDIFTLREFLSNEECNALIARTEQIGFSDAPINTGWQRQEVVKDVRSNTRVMIDDEVLAASLWDRARAYVPSMLRGTRPVGFNERFRFYRYEPGQRFNWHSDGAFYRFNGEQSRLTFLLYLNDGFNGGATRFRDVSIAAEKGKALCFAHELMHEGSEVLTGVKYVARTDVMFGAPKVNSG
jgi:prolyl 4-hydroxylase